MSQATSASAAPQLPGHLGTTPRLSRWLRIRPDGTVEVTPGKVEIGQGILTALVQIVADELDVGLEHVRLLPANTSRSPNEAVTAGSLSVHDCGMALRHVCAEARAIYLAVAAERLGVAPDTLQVRDGTIIGPGNLRTSYWELADDALLAHDARPGVTAKPVAARQLAGQNIARIDMADKVFGRPRFIHDRAFDGLLYGRVLRPATPGAKLLMLDATAAERLPGVVAVVRDGSFVGVVADTEQAAVDAVAHLRGAAQWSEGFELPDETRLADWLRSRSVETTTVDKREAARPVTAVRTVRHSYTRPFLAHASMAPSCAVARWGEPALEVWTHTQGIFNLRADLAIALSRPLESIVVEHMEGAGVFGQNGADDAALDAVLLARAVPGRPVRLQWSREDEMSWAPLGAGMAIDIAADLDAAGEIVGWRHEVWSNGHVSRPGRAKTPTLFAASQLAQPFERMIATNPPVSTGGGAERNSIPLYDFPAWDIISHRVLEMPIRTSSLRTLGAFGNVFALECFLDELCAERGEDPLAYRLRHLADPRARAVLEAAARRAGWSGRRKGEGIGHGLAFARYKNASAYCAIIAEVEGAADIRVRRLVAAVDVGEVINPDGVINQIEGGAIQSTSWTLKEAVRFDRTRILSDTWETYPILRFSEVPEVEVEILSRPSEPAMGAGEAAQGPTAAAIANAVFDALGVRVRDLPITRERIIAAMG
ncbi:MAG: molybdopterin cofactor-binding domain-containing protein [Hyphomicrobiaceae bacterium]